MSKSETARLWAERLQRFDLSGSTVAAFCDAEAVSQPSYYYWRRRLRGLASRAQSKPTSPLTAFMPVKLAPKTGQLDQATKAEQATRPSNPPLACTSIELPGGIRIRIEVPIGPQCGPNSTSTVEDRS